MLVIWTFRSSRKMILVSPTSCGVRTTVRSVCAVASTIFGFPINTVLNGLSTVNVEIKLGFKSTVCRQELDRRPGWQAGVAASCARAADVVAIKIAATNIPTHCAQSLAANPPLHQIRYSHSVGPCSKPFNAGRTRRRAELAGRIGRAEL